MKNFKDFKSFNNHIGLQEPLDEDIDVGYYDPSNMLLKSDPVIVDFYRISFKINFIDKSADDGKPITAVFFNSPNRANGWDVEPSYTGMYLQLSKKIIEKNRFLFKNYLDYGEHEALYLTENEIQEIKIIFDLMFKYYQENQINYEVLISYVHVLISLVEAFYKRQFSTHPKEYNHILSDFQQLLNEYYNQPVSQIPSVQYFADKLDLTPNYLGDIIKHFTQKSAIENIHEVVIKRATTLLKENSTLNNADVAYELGFDYPNYFAKFFKKNLGLTPKQYRSEVLKRQKQ
ncbi:helix-turn-helix domain-containing protein [Flavobacterium sp. LS1R49]|uniref:Helix-turn-helix domain-containing protein n=1 Tax=Flavobacterium shii TaxID=2987687 RepID=A0A9X2ZC74_9FLAO|nr:helix-turn-helix domain-containing protein [Flavobacterium shii]MCV9928681.1 helix-turn-helix domain-containing protein [Flavobacterium shii]